MAGENITSIISSATLGGILIGASAVFLMALLGRIAGISGIFANMFQQQWRDNWHLFFITGIVLGSWLAYSLFGFTFEVRADFSTPLLVVSGLLVGAGTQLGSGCTSGHGICGISRFSKRSIVATLVFMTTAIFTVLLVNIVR
ncbi:YeeE/YedE family protein [Thalassotalea euphylliae]|uniref:YeeE/YedE family protein n=1 Tax=Thalassotalea euphylliae TaxID=1655234 RepID=UPI00363B664E